MNYSRWIDYYGKFKNIFASKRTRAALYAVMVLWVAVITQVFVNRVFQEDLQITEAFIKSDTVEMKSTIEIIAEYDTAAPDDIAKKEIIGRLADAVGLKIDGEIKTREDEDRSEYFYYKQAKQASTELKVVSIKMQEDQEIRMKHYIVIHLSLLKGIQSIDQYKSLLEQELSALGIKNPQVTLKYEGNRLGDLTFAQKQEIAGMLISELQGKAAIEYDEGDIYTVYAYTGMIDEYVTTMDNKINIQISITYNELTDTTRIMLATPVLNDSF